MKEIILVRHGKSSWEYNVSDRERPLTKRGEADAQIVVEQLLKKSSIPQHIFSSPAKRALSTCMIFSKTIGASENSITVVEDLYDFDGQNVINFIKKLPNDYSDVMIFGHNHAFTSISNIFGNIFIHNLPTAGLVKLNIDIDHWNDLKKGTTEFVIIPKEFK
jgi:phosphohistidine phosphatase